LKGYLGAKSEGWKAKKGDSIYLNPTVECGFVKE
jgi:hypothetical protein